ncbi:MFS transporter [Candidatus Woesearchaeota archaeon]|nr:MFS transporter [Candidatus Woesearchaeota archaeon]
MGFFEKISKHQKSNKAVIGNTLGFLTVIKNGNNTLFLTKETISWALYDFANSSYSLLIFTMVFPVYFKEVIAGAEMGDFYWGLAVSISILAAGLFSPVVGAIADYDKRRKQKFVWFTLIAVLGTASLFFTSKSNLFFASVLFILTNFCFDVAIVLYDSFLTHIARKETAGRISGLGWGLGYLGGLVALFAFYPLFKNGYFGEFEFWYKLTFPATAAFYLLFSLPAFFYIKEKVKNHSKNFFELATLGFKNVLNTIKNIKKYKQLFWFFLAFYFVNDSLVTLFSFISIYATNTLQLAMSDISLIYIIIQVIGFPATIIFGVLSDKKGSKKILLTSIVLWIIIVALLSATTNKTMFYIIAVMTGLVIGSSQAIARSWLSRLVPQKKRCEFFGFNGFASKISATTGPIIFGSISVLTGSQRIAMLFLIPFFVLSFIIFSFIKEPKR